MTIPRATRTTTRRVEITGFSPHGWGGEKRVATCFDAVLSTIHTPYYDCFRFEFEEEQ